MFLLITILWIFWQILHFEVCSCAVDAIPVCDPTCLNGASCSAQNSCICPAGYDGDRCQDACLDYLGMENGDIPDGNIQASTYYLTYTSHEARLNGELGWVAESTHSNPWIQADIGYQTYVSGVATQGYYYGTHWVTSFKVSTFSMTTSNPETYIRDNGASAKVFQGNTDGTSIVTSTFPEPVFARIVRITCLERTETEYWVMRFEILGCKRDNELPTIAHNFINVKISTKPGLPNTSVWWNESLSVTDNFGDVTLTSNFQPGDTFPIGNTDVVYTAVDENGNVANVTFVVTVIDFEAPVILHTFSNITTNNDPGLPTANVTWWYNITVSDNSGSVKLTSSSQPGDIFPIGNTDVTYTATDESGNIDYVTFTVTVIDIEAPIITHNFTNITVSTSAGLPTAIVMWTENVTVVDNSGSAKLTSSSHPGDRFPTGNTIVVYTATDESGNIAVMIFAVTVIDMELPTIAQNFTNITVTTDPGLSTAIVWWNKSLEVTDNFGEVALTSNFHPGDTFLIGNTDVVYTAVDENGNVANVTFTVTVIDAEAPTIDNNFSNITIDNDPALPTAIVMWSENVIVTDNSGSVKLTSSSQPGDIFPIGNTDVTYTATDKSENVDYVTFTVTVIDTEAPIIAHHFSNITINNDPGLPTAFVTWSYNITVTDNSGSVKLTSSSQPGDIFPIGNTDVTYRATDASGHVDVATFTVTVIASCPYDIVVVKSWNTSWPMTPAKNLSSVDSNQRCDLNTENRGYGIAKRICWENVHRGAIWADASYVGCGDEDEADIRDLAQTPVVDSNVENVAEALVSVTQNAETLTSDDIEDIATAFQSIVNVEFATPEVTAAVVGIVDNLVDVKSNPKQTTNPSAIVDILKAFETQILKSTEQGSNISVVQPNIVLKTITIQPNKEGKKTSLSFAVRSAKDDDNSFKEGDLLQIKDDNVTQKEEKTRTSISFPAALFDVDGNDTIGVSIVVHNSDALFPTNLTNQTVSGDIISAIVTGIDKVSNLSEPVALQFTITEEHPSCVFWDFELLTWSQKGCHAVDINENKVTCHCNHLTNFAVLVDVTYEKSHIILDVVSKVGCGLSMFCLFITLVIFSSFRRLRSGNTATSRKILMQFCTALFLLYFVFLVGIDQTSNRGGCIFVAFLLHFLTLASLSWMGVEAYHMYLNVVKVFDAIPEKFLLKSSVIAWGCPLLVSSISFGAGMQDYSHLKYCFLANGHTFNYGLVFPIAVIMLLNTITFARVMHRLMRANIGGNVSQKTKAQQISQRLQNAFAISILMGLTWMFGFFAIEGASFAFSLLFCVCNSFQGVVVFVLFCIRQEDVKKTLLQFFRSKFGLSDRFTQSMTASTGVMSSTSQSQTPYGDMDFSLAKIPDATVACTTTDGIDKERITPKEKNPAADKE